jgi:hypothetical protein
MLSRDGPNKVAQRHGSYTQRNYSQYTHLRRLIACQVRIGSDGFDCFKRSGQSRRLPRLDWPNHIGAMVLCTASLAMDHR